MGETKIKFPSANSLFGRRSQEKKLGEWESEKKKGRKLISDFDCGAVDKSLLY